MTFPRHKGFTLIELLVVIAIIGLLTSIVLVSINSARIKARDAKRKSDLHQIQTALAMYYNDNGYYPKPGTIYGSGEYRAYSIDSSWTNLQTLLSPYLAKLPIDPKNTGGCGSWCAVGDYEYNYMYNPTNGKYDLNTQLENPNDPDRCAVKCWRQNAFGGTIAWCPATPCNGSNYLGGPYMYADH